MSSQPNTEQQAGKQDKTTKTKDTNKSTTAQAQSEEMSTYGSGYQWDAASTTTASSLLKDYGSEGQSSRQSSISKAFDNVKSKLSRTPVDEQAALEKAKAKAERKQERKEDYERLGLGERVKYGTRGAGSFGSM